MICVVACSLPLAIHAAHKAGTIKKKSSEQKDICDHEQTHNFIMDFREQYNTEVGERGAQMSVLDEYCCLRGSVCTAR